MSSEWRNHLVDFCFPKGIKVSELQPTKSVSEVEK